MRIPLLPLGGGSRAARAARRFDGAPRGAPVGVVAAVARPAQQANRAAFVPARDPVDVVPVGRLTQATRRVAPAQVWEGAAGGGAFAGGGPVPRPADVEFAPEFRPIAIRK